MNKLLICDLKINYTSTQIYNIKDIQNIITGYVEDLIETEMDELMDMFFTRSGLSWFYRGDIFNNKGNIRTTYLREVIRKYNEVNGYKRTNDDYIKVSGNRSSLVNGFNLICDELGFSSHYYCR